MSDLIKRLRSRFSAGTYAGRIFDEAAAALEAKDAEIERLRAVVDAAKGVTEYGEVAFMGVNIPFKSFRKLQDALAELDDDDE